MHRNLHVLARHLSRVERMKVLDDDESLLEKLEEEISVSVDSNEVPVRKGSRGLA